MKTVIALLIFSLCAFGQTKPKPQLKAIAISDSVASVSVAWTTDSVINAGTKTCIHDFQTVPGSERQQYGELSDSLQQIYNPNHERMIQVFCTKCPRQEIRLEHIVIGKKLNPLKVAK